MTRKAELITADDDITDVFDTIIDDGRGGATTQQKRLDDIVNDLNDDSDEAEIRIYKQSALGGKSAMSFVDSFPADKYSMSELQKHLKKRYGGGDFRVHVRVGGKLKANKLITIESEIVDAVNPNSLAGDGELAAILRVMTEQNAQTIAAIREIANPQESMSRMDMLQEMMLMKQVFDNGSNNNQNGLEQLTQSVELLKDLGVSVGGVGEQKDDDDSFTTILEKAAPLFMNAGQVQHTPQPQPKQNPAGKKPMMNPLIKMALTKLLDAAKKKKDPAIMAEFFIELGGEEKTKAFLLAPDSAQKMLTMCPELKNFTTYVDDLAEHAKAQLGMESKYSHLYEDENSVINGENIPPENDTNDATDLHTS